MNAKRVSRKGAEAQSSEPLAGRTLYHVTATTNVTSELLVEAADAVEAVLKVRERFKGAKEISARRRYLLIADTGQCYRLADTDKLDGG